MFPRDEYSIVSGTWQFPKRVQKEEVLTFAEGLARGADGPRYLDLHVRKVSDVCFGLGFKYRLARPDKKGHEQYFHKTRSLIKEWFDLDDTDGNRLYWDISTPTTVIVHVGL